MSSKFELALHQYIDAFNGNNNVFPAAFKAHFDNLVHKDFTLLSMDGRTISREEVYEREVQKFTSGVTKMTLIHFKKIGVGCVDVKLGLVCAGTERTFRTVSTVCRYTGKIVKSKVIDESPERKIFVQIGGAKCTNFAYKLQEYASPTNTYLPTVCI